MIIYKVTNKINGKIYIGQTKRSLIARKTAHIWEAYHKNMPLRFHQAIRKHGVETFIWEELMKCNSLKELHQREIEQIAKHDSFNRGYNMTIGGPGLLGNKHTRKAKLKMSASNKKHRKGIAHKQESRIQNAVSNGGGKPFIVKNSNGDIVWSGIILSQCAKDLRLSVGNISQCLHRKRKQHNNYTFEYRVE